MIREEQFCFQSNDGISTIHGMMWIPDGEVCGVVQLVHGMSEHIERYREFAQFLAAHGWAVAGHDHLGHGGSVKSEEDFGYFSEKNGSRNLVRDMHSVYTRMKKEYGGVPYIMLGHSMGSFLTRLYLCTYGEGLDGAVICGTGYKPEVLLKTALGICRIEAALFGWRYRSRLLNWMSFGSFNAAFRPNRTESDWLCRREEIVDEYISDARCGFLFTLNGYYNLFLTMYKVIRREYLERMKRDLPVLFIAGARDPVGDCGKGVRHVAELFERTGMRDVECRLYDEDRHELLNELDRENVFADVLEWMERKVKTAN